MVHFVTGGTGFLGRHLVKKLLKEKQTVKILVRNKVSAQKIFPEFPEKNFIEGDITLKNLGISNLKIFKDKKIYIWHLAANLSFQKKEEKNAFKTNIEGTQNIIDFSNKFAKTLFFVSTAYVCGKTNISISENKLIKDPIHRNFYESSKYQAEKLVREKTKINFKIFRPSIILGDAYTGKAKGCTFGYYRFSFIFFRFKNWIVGHFENKTFFSKILKLMGTKWDKNILSLPWLYLPIPKNIDVNLVPLEVVLKTFWNVFKKHKDETKKCFHIVNEKPPSVELGVKNICEDLGLKIKFWKISPYFFEKLIRFLYFIFPFWRKYFESAFSYLPYISQNYNFETKNSHKYLGKSYFDKSFLKKVNRYAIKEIFPNIKL